MPEACGSVAVAAINNPVSNCLRRYDLVGTDADQDNGKYHEEESKLRSEQLRGQTSRRANPHGTERHYENRRHQQDPRQVWHKEYEYLVCAPESCSSCSQKTAAKR
mmetsp:Transcript_65843/g.124523  ORF Transcript_65843/g.124523 Transcript_65843/m.124523 type:complete len:106 (+) Transcript_65843:79-396(+)